MDAHLGVLSWGLWKKILTLITLSLLFFSCKTINNGNPKYYYVLYSQKIADIINEKVKNLDNLDIYSCFINNELKKELKKCDYKSPTKETILIYKYVKKDLLSHGFENSLSDVLKEENYKDAAFSVLDCFYNLQIDFTPASYVLSTYNLFVDNELHKQPAICILEYENSYPIIIGFVTDENGAVLAQGTIVFYNKINLERITSSLISLGLDLDEMYVFPLR